MRLLGRLRYTELAQVDAEARDPTRTGWPIVVRLKGQTDLSEIEIPRLKEQALCPVRHMEEWRRRLRAEKANRGDEDDVKDDGANTSFWIREDGRQMHLAELRDAGKRIMQAAGTNDTHGYMLKHAFLTALRDAGMLAEDLAAYARHKPGSATYTRYLDTTDRLQAGMKKVLGLK